PTPAPPPSDFSTLSLHDALPISLAAAGQSLAFGLILLAMALIALLRGELLDTWQEQLPADAPNHFVLNVLPEDNAAFSERILARSEEHTSELQSRENLVCRLLHE